MKLLKVIATNYKNCCDNFTIDLVAKSKKTSEDKEYELQKIADELYTYNTLAFVGKNASGKTSAIELLDNCYTILSDFRLENDNYLYHNLKLDIYFYHENYIYHYHTLVNSNSTFDNRANFSEQKIARKKYYKSKLKELYDTESFKELTNLGELPEDTSIIFFILKKKVTRAVYFNCDGKGIDTYRLLFQTMQSYHISTGLLSKLIKLFDNNIQELTMLDEKHYHLVYRGKVMELSDSELLHMLSSGTTKGLLLYVLVIAALQNGFDLLIDEVENHFHKTLVENMLSLFKDKMVNKHAATLILTTHYCELLDLFNRQDNIYLAKAEKNVYLENMYDCYNIRPELLKSRQFYNNAFDTAIYYDDLMALKKVLMQ